MIAELAEQELKTPRDVEVQTIPVKIMPISSMNCNSGEIGFDMSEEVKIGHPGKDVIKLEANASVDKII